ncbi:chondroitin AC/alginate lyase [Clavulina sp. PMI_390]|nr:chondroitin AC/alginate lyase [Clavulina sp. PMI_390]
MPLAILYNMLAFTLIDDPNSNTPSANTPANPPTAPNANTGAGAPSANTNGAPTANTSGTPAPNTGPAAAAPPAPGAPSANTKGGTTAPGTPAANAPAPAKPVAPNTPAKPAAPSANAPAKPSGSVPNASRPAAPSAPSAKAPAPSAPGKPAAPSAPPAPAKPSAATAAPTTASAPNAAAPTAPAPSTPGDGSGDDDDDGDDDDGTGDTTDTGTGTSTTNGNPSSNNVGMNAGAASAYAAKAVSYIDTFFLNPSTAMNPNLQYGQLIRGPQSAPAQSGAQGQFMGIVDARGFVSIWNTIAVLRALQAPEWTQDRDNAMMAWATQYLNWLETSDLGQKAAGSANNHGSFWMVQVAALRYILGDYDGVRNTINYFVTHQFQDQIAASGEQPFEAVRTRPFHYRCFNLEALITLAKIGDQVGINMWASQSRYRATIQDALDYVMQEPPGSESIQSLLPHVASVAVAYGDPHQTYANFIAMKDTGATHRTWWWHDVPGAFGPSNKLVHQRREAAAEIPTSKNATGVIWAPGEEPIRPDVFGITGDDLVQLDDAVFVSWDDIRPYYASLKPSVASAATNEAGNYSTVAKNTPESTQADGTSDFWSVIESAPTKKKRSSSYRGRGRGPGPRRIESW